jgi:hypothetical protein
MLTEKGWADEVSKSRSQARWCQVPTGRLVDLAYLPEFSSITYHLRLTTVHSTCEFRS